MHICVQTLPFDDSLEDVFSFLKGIGVGYVDLSIPVGEYVDDDDAQRALRRSLDEHGIEISVLSAAGNNPLHPVDDRAETEDERLRDAIRLADQLDVDTVTSFSGLPGFGPDAVAPNWLAAPIPSGPWSEAYEYQWEVAIDYWGDLAAFADEHDVDVAIEIHLNTLVSKPTEMMRLREATNERIGGYVDPAHLTVQGIDPVESIRYLAEDDALHHFEASDVQFYESNLRLKGVADMTPSGQVEDRAWTFCAVGYGQSREYWVDVVDALAVVGYDGPVSLQHLRTPQPLHESVERSVAFLEEIVF